MRKIDQKLIYSPSDLITFMESAFDSWADRFSLEHPGELAKDQEDAAARLICEHGNKHEKLFLEKLQQTHAVCEIRGDKDFAAHATLTAMRGGSDVIYQGYLTRDNFAGLSDFLVKVPGASKLGDFHYEVWDTKLARKAKPYFVVQLCCYAEMLEELQGIRPQTIRIVLGDNSVKSFVTDDYFEYYLNLKRRFMDFQNSWSRTSYPPDSLPGPHTSWQSFADQLLAGKDDLCIVANIRQSQIKKLKAAGIHTIAQLAQTEIAFIPKLRNDTFSRLQLQARLQLQTLERNSPSYHVLPPQEGKGLTVLPPSSALDVFFDMEGYPHTEGGLEYLFGAVIEKDCQSDFVDWWAHNRAEEKTKFEQFIDWVWERWQLDPQMHVYHYAAYEVSALKRLAGRHNTRIEQLDELLRQHVFVDLYQIVRHSLVIGQPSYSIKYVEHLYRSKRTGSVAKATDSVVYYESWLEQQDGAEWQTSPILSSIRQYNRDDCLSTLDLAKFLRNLQLEEKIAYKPAPLKTGNTKDKTPDRTAAVLAQELFQTAPALEDAEKRRVQTLLAGILEFHRREDKPKWWHALETQESTEDELFENLDCLYGLVRTTREPILSKQSLLYEYQFDVEQPTRIEAGDSCRFVHDVYSTITPQRLDSERGTVWLPVSRTKQPPPETLSLIRNDMVPSKHLAEAILRIVQRWKQDGKLSDALGSFLFRKQPAIKDIAPGGAVVRDSSLEEIARAVGNMQNTCLCIQGPPGAGKTTSAGYTIARLLAEGKRVGITSNSHKAIANLLKEIAGRCHRSNIDLRAVQVCSKDSADIKKDAVQGVRQVQSSSKLFDDEQFDFNLVAGTAWVFSNPRAACLFDYLFVDEAGQVCLANVVSMSESTRNLVLLGDQQQLEQPIQGAHPEDVSKSALEYLLQEQSTISPSFGIFLDISRRMHPELCRFISETVYDSRLTADPANSRQIVVPVKAAGSSVVSKTAGLVWVPCEHQGNSQSSAEEAELIASLVNDLLRYEYTNKAGAQKAIQLNDIIIVAPYNLQASLISKRLPGARVASVDKFQGSEAPIVILSMCASDGRNSPRGLEFLFNRSRLNVAISRAKSMAFVVGSPSLLNTAGSTLEQMKLLNFFCRIVKYGSKCQEQGKDKIFVEV